MIQSNTIKGKNKATDLKRLIQQACNSQKAQTTETIAPLSARNKGSTFESSKPKQNQRGDTNLSKGDKQKNTSLTSNTTKGLLTTISIKNKQNICVNKKSPNPHDKLSSSISSVTKLGKNVTKSMKQIKINPISISTSIQLPKLKKITTSTATSRDRKAFKFQSSYDSVRQGPLSARDRERDRGLISPRRSMGLKITDFNLGKKLGKGRFGNVRLAQDKATKFILAIKTINIEQLKQSEMQSQLIEEIKLQMYCNHPNILKMYGCFNDSKNIYLLLQLGISCLFQELRTEKYFSEEKTAYYGKQIVESLKYVHNESIIHRDIKPENILITYGVLKLSDFGWSTYSPQLKRQTFCGTLDYVCPEIVNGDYYDEKVDIWSLGVLFYELAVGKAPFEDPNNSQEGTYDKILGADIEFPQRISDDLQDLIFKILLKNPNERLLMSQIQNHPWMQKYKTTGRFISKQIWDLWEGIKNQH